MTPFGGASSADGSDVSAVDQNAERAVLGALLIYGDPQWVRGLVAKGLTPEDFYWERHGQVYSAMTALGERRAHVDSVTVAAELERQLGRPVDAQLIEEFCSYAPGAGGVGEYAEIVIRLAQWRWRRRQAYEMLTAVEARDIKTWDHLVRAFEAAPASKEVEESQPRLRLVVDGETGAVVKRYQECPECEKLKGELAGAERDLRGWRTRYAILKKEREEEAREGALWLVAQALFELWKKKTGHTRSPFSYRRFSEVEPYLHSYDAQKIERAIAGIAYDPYKKLRKNGTWYKKDWWEDLFYNQKVFENYANAAPRGWKPELRISIETETPVEPGESPAPSQLNLIQKSAG